MSATLAANATAGYAARRGLRLVAAEGSAGYLADAVVATFEDGLDALLDRSLDELDEPTIEAEIRTVESAERRLRARKARAAAVLADRHGRRAAEANPERARRAAEQAARQVQDRLADENGWSATEAKDNQRLGKVLDRSPRLAEAAQDGELPPANAIKMGRFFDRLSPEDRTKVEDRLLEAARTQDPVTFARTIETIRGELNPEDAAEAEQQRHARRSASVSRTADGMTRIYAELATVDGALVTRAIDTFRRMDAPGEHRRPEQRTADALVETARAALQEDGAEAPSRNHGTRPHVVVTVPIDVLLAGGMVDIDGTDVPLDAVRHLLDDAGWAFVVTRTNTTPIAVTGESRTVSAALWRALVLRDGGCIHEACDAKPDWCDVMHLIDPHRDGGRLALENSGLGCRTHHRAYDNGRLELHWNDDKPVLLPRGRSPDSRAGPAP